MLNYTWHCDFGLELTPFFKDHKLKLMGIPLALDTPSPLVVDPKCLLNAIKLRKRNQHREVFVEHVNPCMCTQSPKIVEILHTFGRYNPL